MTDPPWQNVIGPFAEMVGGGVNGLTVMVIGAEVTLLPHVLEMATEYIPAELTVMLCVFSPLLHR